MKKDTLSKLAIIFYYCKYNRNSINALAGAIEDDHQDVEIYFCDLLSEVKTINKVLLENKYKVVIATSCLINQLREIKLFIQEIKKENNATENQYIIVGGPTITGKPELAVNINCDYIAIGEAEESFNKFIKEIKEGNKYFKIEGLGYKVNNEIILVKSNKWLEIEKYKPFSVRYKKFGPIEISRGCSYSCSYCQTSNLYKHNLRHRSIDNICKYIKILIDNNLRDIRFISSNAFLYGSQDGKNVNIKSIEELLRNILKILKGKGRVFFGTFPSEVRPEHVSDETMALIKQYASNNNIIIGGQSGSDKILRKCNRNHNAADIVKAVEICNKYKILPNVDFIFGIPGEDNNDIADTFLLINELINLGAKIHAHIFMPLPGTPFWNMQIPSIPNELIRKLELLSSKGVLYGQWKRQLSLRDWIKEIY